MALRLAACFWVKDARLKNYTISTICLFLHFANGHK